MKPITAEQARILLAARERRLRRNQHFRLYIDGEPRPNRRERERLQGRQMLSRDDPPKITQRGDEALNLYLAVGVARIVASDNIQRNEEA